MRSGFLGGGQSAAAKQEASRNGASGAPDAAQQQHSPEAGAAAAAAAAAAHGPQPTPEQAEHALAECLELLKGPSDEHRFVGLLLVTKLLPVGDAATVQRVHAATGPTFLSRLLLPLRATPAAGGAPPASLEAAQKAAASAGLGLAVLSSFTRVPELAAGEDALEKMPLLLNVARAGGITPLLAAAATRGSGGGGGAAFTPDQISEPAAEAAAVLDALESAVAVASSGTEGCVVAAESGAVSAAAAVMQRCPPAQTQQLSLALALLAAVLADERQRVQLIEDDPAMLLQQLLAALARVFALPAAQLAGGRGQAQGQSDEGLQRRLLAVQLEALHVLLLLLPLPPGAEQATAEQLAAGAAWPAHLRAGLGLLLRGRISAVQRHSALQLAAAALDLAGPAWLLGGGASGSRAAAGAQEAAAFYQLLVEVTKIETSVLLHDALAPDVPVPLASAPRASAADWRAPAPRAAPRSDGASSGGGSEAGDGLHEVSAELAADLAGGDDDDGSGDGDPKGADMEPLVRILSSEEDRRQLEAQLQREQAEAEAELAAAGGRRPQQGDHVRLVDGVDIPADMRWEGPSEAAGARAGRVLPACFALLEGCIEALAADTQCAEAAMDAAGPGGAAATNAARPVLSGAVAQRALFSLQEAVEVVLQFIEQTTCEEEEEQAAAAAAGGAVGGASPLRRALLLAALRALARFCAEVPEAFGGRLRPLLPTLLALRAGGGSPAGNLAAAPPAEGCAFLLPLLLQVSDPGYASGGGEAAHQEQAQWLDTLAQPAVLHQLLAHALQCATCCAPAAGSAAATAADDALLYACQVLLNVAAAGGEAAVSEQQREVRRRLAAAPEAAQLLQALLGLAQRRPLAPGFDGSPEPVVHACRLRSVMAALGGVLATSAPAQLGASSADPQQQQQQAAPLGPIAGPAMRELCAQLLSALQAARLLTCSAALCRQLRLPLPAEAGAAGAAGAVEAAACLEAARAEVEADEALQLELLRSLDMGAAEAATLLQRYPPFAQLAAAHPFVAAQLAAAGAGLAEAAAAAPPGLHRFLAAAAARESA